MDHATFFEKFELFADAPDAVGQMRELVLELAVQGRLVSQHANEETAHALLERVTSAAKSRGRGAGEYEDTDSPFPIPETWAWVRLPRVLKKLTDGTHHSPPNGPSGAFMYVTAKNIKTDGVLFDGITYVSKEVHDEIYSRCDPSFGDILYIKDGATTGIATINQVKEPFSMLSSVALLKPSEAILNRYLLWAMRSPFFYAETRGAMKGAAITRVTLSGMAASLLPLPPLAEQKRIVAKVDELMALCDRLEAQQQERQTRHAALARASLARFADAPTPANLQFLFHPSCAIPPADLRKSILTLAVQGKLVPQDPNDEPAAITADSHFDGPFDIPEKWSWIHLADLQPEFQNGASSRGDKDGIPVIVIRLADVDSRRISLDDPRAIAISKDQIVKYRLEFGDTLITRVNGSADIVGTFIPVLESLDAIYCDHFIRMRIDPERLFPAYTALVGDSQLVREQIRNLFITTAGQKTVNQGHIRSLSIPLPPLAEQRRIVAKVEQLMALVDGLETELAASRATAANLLSALVAELTAANGKAIPAAHDA